MDMISEGKLLDTTGNIGILYTDTIVSYWYFI